MGDGFFIVGGCVDFGKGLSIGSIKVWWIKDGYRFLDISFVFWDGFDRFVLRVRG